MKPLTFTMPLFPARIRVFFTLAEYLARYPDEQRHNFTDFKAFVQGQADGICMVFVHFSLPILAHESVHAAGAVLLRAGVQGDYHNDEPLAYSVEHIFKTVQKHYEAKN